jgi:hypothetical protein
MALQFARFWQISVAICGVDLEGRVCLDEDCFDGGSGGMDGRGVER